MARSGDCEEPYPDTVRERRKVWSEGAMERALKDVTNGVLGVRRAALEYNIPKSTLSDRVSGRVRPGATSGAPRYLDAEEEEEVVRWITGCAEVGCTKSVREVRAVVSAIVAKKFGVASINISHGWWDKFRQRHPELVLRTGEAVAYRRAVAVNKETIYHYFDLLEATLQSNGLLDRPSLVFNADESGMPLSHHPGKRGGIRGMKRVCTVTSGVKTQVTVLCCISASGCAIPPLVIFQRKSLLKGLTVGEVPGTMYGLNPQSGWIDGEIFKEWFVRHFLVYAPAGRPLLLLVDGHSSHFNPAFIREAANHGVVVFCQPPNTTHVSQPLDSTCFRSLKAFWIDTCDECMCQNPGKVVTLYQFSKLFASAFFMKAMTPRNISSSFRVTGVFPPTGRPSQYLVNLRLPSAQALLQLKLQAAMESSIFLFTLRQDQRANSETLHVPSMINHILLSLKWTRLSCSLYLKMKIIHCTLHLSLQGHRFLLLQVMNISDFKDLRKALILTVMRDKICGCKAFIPARR